MRKAVTRNVFILLFALALPLSAQQLTPAEKSAVDSIARATLAETGAPSASLAIVRGGEIVYEQAYGTARVNPDVPASPHMRYAIGSVSKQFTAAALLLLEEDGKLSIDDKVSKWFPQLTRAGDISIRNLLSMTSGYQDYWPHDYVFTEMKQPATPESIMERWAGKALDFEPGTKWQYSNTNYVIAARIVEKVSGMPFMDFLRTRIFTPLGMTTVADYNEGPLTTSDAAMLLRHALGPLRTAPKEAKDWLFGAAQLAMTSHDLALWNLSIINQSLLKPASYARQQTDMLLKQGTNTGYGLGINVGVQNGRRRLAHGGAVSGYTTTNVVYPDDRAAIVVFTNIYPGGGGANAIIANRVANVILSRTDTAAAAAQQLAERVYRDLMKGTIDRSLFTDHGNAYFAAEVLADYAASLGPLGEPEEFTRGGDAIRGGLRIRGYSIRVGNQTLGLTMMLAPDGRIEEYVVES